jgi:hypothetical protein
LKLYEAKSDHRLGLGSGVILAAVILMVGITAAQQPREVKEKAAGNEIATVVRQTRREHGLSHLWRISDGNLRKSACQLAAADSLSEGISDGSSLDKVGTISIVRCSTANPQEPSANLLEWAMRKPAQEEGGWVAHRFAVGVCYVQSAKHPEGRYWICAAKYMGAIKSFFYAFVWE